MANNKTPRNSSILLGFLTFLTYHLSWFHIHGTGVPSDSLIESLTVFILAASIPEAIHVLMIMHKKSPPEINLTVIWIGVLTWISIAVYGMIDLFSHIPPP